MRLLYIIGLFISGLLLGVSLWNLDWLLWKHYFYAYYIPGLIWGVRTDKFLGNGFWANLQYLQIVVAFVLAIVCTYGISRSRRGSDGH